MQDDHTNRAQENLGDLVRIRRADLCAMLKVSRSTFYDRLSKGLYPKPDGYDGTMPYWKARTIRTFLAQ